MTPGAEAAWFALRLKRDFFTDRTRVLLELVAEGWLIYEGAWKGRAAYFRVDIDRLDAAHLPRELKARLVERQAFSCYEIDDLLLGHFEDLHSLWKRDLLDLGLIAEGFGWYIAKCVANSAICRYIEDEQKASPGVWGGVLALREALVGEPGSR